MAERRREPGSTIMANCVQPGVHDLIDKLLAFVRGERSAEQEEKGADFMASVAYLFLAHGKPFQLIDLIWSLWREEDLYFLHLDRKSPPWSRAALEAIAAKFENVHIVPADVLGRGGFTLIEATQRCLLAAFATSRTWTHAVLASGTHVPLRHASELAASLQPGSSYLNFHRLDLAAADLDPPTWHSGMARRLTFGYLEVPGLGHMRGQVRESPKGVDFFYGSHFWVLDRRAAEYTLEQRGGPLDEFFRHATVPEECYYQTLLVNSPFKHSLVNTLPIWQEWGADGHPLALSTEALRKAFSSKCLFARKAERWVFLEPERGLSINIASVDREEWTASVVQAFADFLPPRIVDPVTHAYLGTGADSDLPPDESLLALRTALDEVTAVVRAAANARGLAVKIEPNLIEGGEPEGRVRCTLADARTAARYILCARMATPYTVWVSICVPGSERDRAMVELRNFPQSELISPDFPPIRRFHPFHDILADPLRRRGVVSMRDPRGDETLRQVIGEYVDVLAAIGHMTRRAEGR